MKKVEIVKHAGDKSLIGQIGTIEKILTSFKNPVYIVKLESGREINVNSWNIKRVR
jgi:hypothetical protein